MAVFRCPRLYLRSSLLALAAASLGCNNSPAATDVETSSSASTGEADTQTTGDLPAGAQCGDGVVEAGQFCFDRIAVDLDPNLLRVVDLDADERHEIAVIQNGASDLEFFGLDTAEEGLSRLQVRDLAGSPGVGYPLQLGDFDQDGSVDLMVSSTEQISTVFDVGDPASEFVHQMLGATESFSPIVPIPQSTSAIAYPYPSPLTPVEFRLTGQTWEETGTTLSSPRCYSSGLTLELPTGELFVGGQSGECQALPEYSDPGEALLFKANALENPTMLSLPTMARGVAVATRDGVHSLVVSSEDPHALTIFRPNAAGEFNENGQTIEVAEFRTDIKAGDFDGDKNSEVLAIREGQFVLLSLSDASATPFELGAKPLRFDVGDFNGDGVSDVLNWYVEGTDFTAELFLSNP